MSLLERLSRELTSAVNRALPMSGQSQIASVDDAIAIARARLPKGMVDAIASGSGREITLRWNTEAYDDVIFRPRTPLDTVKPDLSTTVLGHPVSMPLMIAPTGNIRMFHSDGEPAVARVAGEAGIIHMVSCFTGYPIEDITRAATGPVFFDMYIAGGRDNVPIMLDRAAKAGCAALVITMDIVTGHGAERPPSQRLFTPMIGMNPRTIARYGPQLITKPGWTYDFVRDGMRLDAPMWIKPNGKPASFGEMAATILAEAPTWKDLPWIRSLWNGPIIMKGLLDVEDARRAVDEGVDAIVVSNHGARNVDGSPATLWALPDIVEAVDGRLEVYMDGGIRRGTDVVKALALGARAVLLGRAYVWAHAAAGGEGVRSILQVFKHGMEATLTSLSCPSVMALDQSYVTVRAGSQLDRSQKKK